MKKLDLPGAHAVGLSITDELFHQMYCFDTSDFDAGYLGAMYADLIHHALLEEANGPRPPGADMKEIALVHDLHAGDSLSIEEWTDVARGVLGMVMPYAVRAMNNLKPRVIARVGVLLEPPEGQPIILLEFCYEHNC